MSNALPDCMVKDQAELTLLAKRIAQRDKHNQPCDKLKAQLLAKAQRSHATYQRRLDALPKIEYPP
nr:hypothetical protein [Oceanospirillaceae bacterium]